MSEQTLLERPRRTLFLKYLLTISVAVLVPLALSAISETWFGYRDQRARIGDLLQAESRAAANRIETFIEGIREQLGWVVQLAWTPGEDERHRIDALRLLRQVPAILSITLVDEAAAERVFVSRLGLDRMASGVDLSLNPAVIGARTNKVWYGPVRYERDSEPYMSIAVAGNRAAAGIAIADINLKLIWDVISAIKIGASGKAFVVDDLGRLIADPDISLVLRGIAGSDRAQATAAAAVGSAIVTTGDDGKSIILSSARIAPLKWTVIAQQPLSEAFSPIRAALWRSLLLIVAGTLLALGLAYWLARRMSGPIQLLDEGAKRVGAGDFEHRIKISSGDELELLANRFNAMAGELTASKEKSERINRLKRFLAPQVAELVEHPGNEGLLEGQRRNVVTIFGDLRGFTAFSAHAQPDVIMHVLSEYYEALGAVTTQHQATLTGLSGDGFMVLVNAPVECEQPAARGLQLAIDMQAAVQALIVRWRSQGYAIGFGVGVAMGSATVGTVGYEGRTEYTAIGSVVNLASRLCGAAVDGQILLDVAIADAARDAFSLDFLGERSIKGYDQPLPIFSIAGQR